MSLSFVLLETISSSRAAKDSVFRIISNGFDEFSVAVNCGD